MKMSAGGFPKPPVSKILQTFVTFSMKFFLRREERMRGDESVSCMTSVLIDRKEENKEFFPQVSLLLAGRQDEKG